MALSVFGAQPKAQAPPSTEPLFDVFLFEKGTQKQVGRRRNLNATGVQAAKDQFKELDVKKLPLIPVVPATVPQVAGVELQDA